MTVLYDHPVAGKQLDGQLYLRYSQKQQNSQALKLQDTSWWLATLLVILQKLSRPIVSFLPIKIRLEIAEIQPKVAKQLATAILEDQLGASQMVSQFILIEQTNFLFYPIKIQLEMNEIRPKVAKQVAMAILGRIAVDQLDGQLDYTN